MSLESKPKHPYRLTVWGSKQELRFAERQLRKYGAKREIDYCWEEYGKLWAIVTLR